MRIKPVEKYIGANTYVRFDGEGFALTTESDMNGRPSDVIYLTRDDMDGLTSWAEKVMKEIAP